MKFIDRLKSSKIYQIRLSVERFLNATIGLFLFQYKRKDNLFSFFYDSLVYQNVVCHDYSPTKNYYEFGVASGGSIKIYILALKKFCKDYKKNINDFHIFAFDSFQGLPKEGVGDNHVIWGQSQMVHPKEQVLGVIRETKFPIDNFHSVDGFYDTTLTTDLRDKFVTFAPAIINIDCDYYSSTIMALKWLMPLLSSGAIFRFDDIWAYHGHPDYGELKAINEFNNLGFGQLQLFPLCGLPSYVYIYSKKFFEYDQRK